MKFLSLIVLILSVCTGCLKSDDLILDGEPSPLVLVNDSNWPTPVYDWSTPPADSVYGTSKLTLRASLSSGRPLNDDTKVSFNVDLNAMTEFNTAWSADYKLLPENAYSGILEVVIPAGRVDGSALITVDPAKFDGQSNYVLPVTIASASNGLKVAENRRLLLFTLQGY